MKTFCIYQWIIACIQLIGKKHLHQKCFVRESNTFLHQNVELEAYALDVVRARLNIDMSKERQD